MAPSPARRSVPFSVARYLSTRARFGWKLGLDTMRRLLTELGDPHLAAPVLLVGGTNGKGSVVAYADAGLRACGLSVGRYVSPHLVRVNERIAVNGADIDERSLGSALRAVRDATEALRRRGSLDAQPTHFEVLTAAAFLHFRARRVDVALLEVGLGGRLDATNVSEPLVSAIVSIDFDHEMHLGRTLAAIAAEKAGILRAGRVTVVGPMLAAPARTIAAEARSRGARLVESSDTAVRRQGDALIVITPCGRYENVGHLPGRHQETNVVVALRLLEEARAAGLPVDVKRAAAAMGQAQWPGRLERIDGRPPVLLDGAHNAAGARALAAYLKGQGNFVLVFGMMADKAIAEAARRLFPLARRVVLTQPRMKRAASPREVRKRAGAVARGALLAPTTAEALRVARRLALPGETVVVSGSLFLVGEALRILRRRAEKRRRRPR